MTKKLLYGRKTNEPEYMETLLTENEELFADAEAWARENGYVVFRVAEVDMRMPLDFANVVRGNR